MIYPIVKYGDPVLETPAATITDDDHGRLSAEQLTREQDAASCDLSRRMAASSAPLVADREQRASSFATYLLTDNSAGTDLAEPLAGDGQYFLGASEKGVTRIVRDGADPDAHHH